MTNEEKDIQRRFDHLFLDLDLTNEQAENITYLKRCVLDALREKTLASCAKTKHAILTLAALTIGWAVAIVIVVTVLAFLG